MSEVTVFLKNTHGMIFTELSLCCFQTKNYVILDIFFDDFSVVNTTQLLTDSINYVAHNFFQRPIPLIRPVVVAAWRVNVCVFNIWISFDDCIGGWVISGMYVVQWSCFTNELNSPEEYTFISVYINLRGSQNISKYGAPLCSQAGYHKSAFLRNRFCCSAV